MAAAKKRSRNGVGGRPKAPDGGTKKARLAESIDEAIRDTNADADVQNLATIAVLEARKLQDEADGLPGGLTKDGVFALLEHVILPRAQHKVFRELGLHMGTCVADGATEPRYAEMITMEADRMLTSFLTFLRITEGVDVSQLGQHLKDELRADQKAGAQLDAIIERRKKTPRGRGQRNTFFGKERWQAMRSAFFDGLDLTTSERTLVKQRALSKKTRARRKSRRASK